MPNFQVGQKVRWNGEEGEVTEVVDDLKCVRCRFKDGRVMRIPVDQVQSAPSHKQVKGPA